MKKLMIKSFSFFDDIIQERKRHSHFLSILLHFFSYLWRLVICFRDVFYKLGLLSEKKSSSFVVSIGNISVGGTGKTPLVILLAQELTDKKIPTAILSRGYRSFAEKNNENVLLHKKEGLVATWHHIGDEPALLLQRLKDALLIVGKDRVKSSQMAENEKVKILILDDGLQYRKLKKDQQIITLNAQQLLKKNFLLPRGGLREPFSALSKADMIVVNYLEDKSKFPLILEKIRRYSSSLVIATKAKIDGYFDLQNNRIEIETNIPVAVFSAIAFPKNFLLLLDRENFDVVMKIEKSDHFSFSQQELLEFSKRAKSKGAKYLLCTEKDSIKLISSIETSLPIIFIKMKLDIIIGNDEWKKYVEKIGDNANN